MIEYNFISILPKGELYIEHETEADFNQFGYFSFDPLNTDFEPKQIIDKKFDVLSDFLNFLNFNEYGLNTAIDIIERILLNSESTPVLDAAIAFAKKSLASFSFYFSCHTEYYLYDLIIHHFIDVLFFDAVVYDDSINSDQVIDTFISFQQSLIEKIFTNLNSLEITDLLDYYNSILNSRLSWEYHPTVLPKPCDEIMKIRNFIAADIPHAQIGNTKDKDRLQKFIYKINTYSDIKRLTPYSITNHAKCQNLELFKYFLFSQGDLGESFSNYRRNIFNPGESLPTAYMDVTKIFVDSAAQVEHTYSISSFYDFIVAELYTLFDNPLSLNRCEHCRQFKYRSIAWENIFPHACSSNINSKDMKEIQELYDKTKRNIDQYFKYSPKPNNEKDKERALWKEPLDHLHDDLSDYLHKTYEMALSSHMSYEEYNKFINQPHLKHTRLATLLKNKLKADDNSSDDIYRKRLDDTIYFVKTLRPKFGEIITTEGETAMIEEYKRRGYNHKLEPLMPESSNDYIDSATDSNVELSQNKDLHDHPETSSAPADSGPDDNVTQ